jgi:hypothetical protein
MLSVTGSAALAGPEEFQLVTVTVVVCDPWGEPVQGSQAKAYSEDWHMRFPRNGPGVTDAQGRLAYKVPVGHYTFFAGGPPDYTTSHPGQGFYVVKGPMRVTQSCQVVLQPDSLIRIRATALDGSPLQSGRLLVSESGHVPFIHMPHVGQIDKGRIDLATSRGFQYHLVADTVYEPSPLACVLGQGNVPAGKDVWLRGDQSSELAHLRVEAYDRNNGAAKGCLYLAFPELCADGLYLLPEVNGARDYVFTPTLLQLVCTLRDERGSCSTLGRLLRLAPSQETVLRFGGRISPGSFSPLISTEFGYTEFMLVPKDAFGNGLALAVDLQGNRQFEVSVLEKGQPIAREQLKTEGAPLAVAGFINQVFEPARELEYLLSLDLFPLGQHNLRGRLAPNLRWEENPAGPFVLHTPPGYPTQTAVLVKLIERIAEAQANTMGAVPAGRGFPAWVKVNPVYPRPGSPIGVNAMFFDGFLALDPAAVESDCSMVVAHEVGHVMQGGGDGPKLAWYVTLPAVEAEANLLAVAAKSSLYSERVAWNDAGEILNREFVEKWQAGLTTGEMFPHNLINLYILKQYGWEVHRRSYRLGWLGEGGHAAALQGLGLKPEEGNASVLSYLCGTNLGWLYRLAHLEVGDEQIEKGTALLRERGVPRPTDP